jgi:hypothetical protein
MQEPLRSVATGTRSLIRFACAVAGQIHITHQAALSLLTSSLASKWRDRRRLVCVSAEAVLLAHGPSETSVDGQSDDAGLHDTLTVIL